MEKIIRKATDDITGIGVKYSQEFDTELSKCAVEIATIAITAFRGALRDKALDIAKAIVEYEDIFKALAHSD